MSLAVDFLREFFARRETSQTDFARAAGMTPTNVTDLLKGDVAISGRNLDKLLRGFRSEKDRRDFLTAYLRDQIPADYADDITIQLRAPAEGMVCEGGDERDTLDAQIMLGFAALPSDLFRRRLVNFVQHLRGDAQLRDLFARTVAYLEEEDGCGLDPDTLRATAEEKQILSHHLTVAQRRKDKKTRSTPRAQKPIAQG